MSPPRSTCAIARRGRPCPLRSLEHVEGLPGLPEKDQRRLNAENLLLQFACSVLIVCRRMGIPATLEFPQLSRAFRVPCLSKIINCSDTTDAVCHFCMFGLPWRRATRFVGVNIDLSRLEYYCCRHLTRGLCARTQRPHVQVTREALEFHPLVSKTYPTKLCTELAHCFYNAMSARTASYLTSLLEDRCTIIVVLCVLKLRLSAKSRVWGFGKRLPCSQFVARSKSRSLQGTASSATENLAQRHEHPTGIACACT